MNMGDFRIPHYFYEVVTEHNHKFSDKNRPLILRYVIKKSRYPVYIIVHGFRSGYVFRINERRRVSQITMKQYTRILLVGCTLLLSWYGVSAQSIQLNELMSANVTTIADEDNEYPDWVEFYNPGNDTGYISGYGLSDDPDNLFKWRFPDVLIPSRAFLLVFLSGKDRDIWVRHWETVIFPSDLWSYKTGQTAPGNGWQTRSFDDQSWQTGPGGIGYGDGDDVTVIDPVISLYLRKKFTIRDTGDISALLLHMDYDDAFVAYLNGVEVARANIGTAGIEPSYNQEADAYKEAEIYRGGKPERYDLMPYIPILHAGENILAVQVHNFGSGSSDLSAIPFLSLGLTKTPENPRDLAEILEEDIPELHTNFKIASEGESLFLTHVNGNIVDSLSAVTLLQDKSIGRQPDGTAQWVYFDEPTPGAPNNTPGYTGISESPVPSRISGFYPGPFLLNITSPGAGAEIYYTIDGSVPGEQKLLFANDLMISKTTVLRCRSFEPGKLPSPVITCSFFIGETQNLPVISISTEPGYLWSADSGIYVKGPGAQPEFPYFDANFWQDWEIPVFLEFFETDGRIGFNEAAGMKITGSWSRGFPQKSLAVFFRGEYGITSLAYPLFPDQNIDIYDEFVLRNSGNDWGQTFIRDAFMTKIGKQVGLEAQACRPVVVYLNGAYWGIHNMREKVNEDFLAAHHPVDPDNLDMLENNMVSIEGDDEHYRDMINIVANQNVSLPEVYNGIAQRMDIDNFIDYTICEIFIGNTDWPGNNIKFWRPRTPEGRWRWILFDTDFGFGLFQDSPVNHNTLAMATASDGPAWPNPPWSTLLLRRLLENDEFRITFINRFADLLNTNFQPSKIKTIIAGSKSVISPEIERHLIRWELDPNGWAPRVARLNEYATLRLGNMRMYLSAHFGLGGLVQVGINNPEPESGSIRLNSVLIDQPSWQGAYFKNIPIKLTAVAHPGWRFDHWSGMIISNSNPLTLLLTETTNITAHFIRDSLLVINEINYNSSPLFDVGDWIELLYTGGEIIDISGWQFRDEDDLHVFEFPAKTMVEPGSFVVICNDSIAFTSGFPGINNLSGVFDFGLSGAGELIRLFDDRGVLIDSLTYGDSEPWPVEADGQGATLALDDPFSDNSKAENWYAASPYGTPGKANSTASQIEITAPVNLPRKFSIGPAYPNPFNPATRIPFDLPQAAKVSVRVYDITGSLVTSLLEGNLPAGSHEVNWHPGPGSASGIYFFLIDAGTGRKGTGKLILLR